MKQPVVDVIAQPDLETGLVLQPEVSVPAVSVLSVIARAATDANCDVDKMERLLQMQERIMAREAEAEFNRDFAAASLKMPRITKHGMIDLRDKGKIPFAKYEDIDRVLRPIEAEHGFMRSFRTEPCDKGIRVTIKVSHRGGHSETSTREMPPDPGPGRNAMQAIGSASSYAKRYLTLDFWNIITIGQDDDSVGTERISEQKAQAVEDLLHELGMSQDPERGKFLETIGAKSVSDMHPAVYTVAMNFLQMKRRRAK